MTPPAASQGIDLGASTGVRDPSSRWRRVFPGRDDQVREVRRWLAGLLPGAPERDDVVVVAVELVTNAIRHTASGRGGLIVVEVTWCGPALPAPPPRAGRHRPVPSQMRPAEAGGQTGRGRPGRALAVVPASRSATAGSGA